MIKFFRKIRQNLLLENKTGKYLKYAIGEILLVVIGILLALQINNWNERRKLKINDLQLCKELLNDAIADSIFYESRHVGLNELKATVNYILEKPELRKPDSTITELVNEGDQFMTIIGFRYLSNVVSNRKNSIQELQSKSVINALRRYFLRYDYVAAAFQRLNTLNETELNPLKKKHMNHFINLKETHDLNILNTIYDDEMVQKSMFIIDGYIDDVISHLLVFQEDNRELIIVLKKRIDNSK
ncbi:DUF6090 family protein [Croceitalea vernalis]|uniref:DUF6090 family protein n=1 Tax=Croceitalea vernalis TaxID=3075599 RepID=A0ABU3BKJ0_9FLAO|nr:DUF6090 family protein [Croceitalea sp. P007]MDT0622672.1 DUF6090 family protein [Croceitalea sp. P007]